MKPYYQDGSVTIYHGEALSVLCELPSNSVDVLMTDPPYSSGGMIRGDRLQDVHTKYVQTGSESGGNLEAFSGDSRDQMGWLFWCGAWLHGSQRVIVDGGIAAFFCDWRQLPVATMGLQSGGYVWRGIVPWHKPSARPTQGRWANKCEYVVWGTNGPRELTGRGFPGFYSYNVPSGTAREHITQKPIELMQSMLEIVPAGGTVLDPFMGSGTTILAAKNVGARAIGCEVSEHFCEIAARRCSQETLDLGAP